MFSILCVCLGNICRSPLAEGVLAGRVVEQGLSGRVRVESCGTAGYHAGESPHSGSVRCARGHGLDISGHRARQLRKQDFQEFDLILAMDRSNLEDIKEEAGRSGVRVRAKIAMLNDYLPADYPLKEVPDPWYAHDQAKVFEEVYEMARRAADGVLAEAPQSCPALKGP